ncbi:MAG: Glycosyl transferase group 1 [candidate division TM6 bacterium GW2011_GWF2_28_16]|nr:MAG: Glycosyl transferase group 1 [candidate division TM6 bacterium GW2011_GWF2_28_16]
MNIGFYFGPKIDSDPKSGGGFTFAMSIFQELCKTSTDHNIYIFSEDAEKFYDNKDINIKFIKINRYYASEKENLLKKTILKLPRKILRFIQDKKYKNALNKSVLENKIDLMWFATPAFEFVVVPYVYTVWDLQHRKQTYFPELVINSEFENREKSYNSIIPKAAFVITGNKAGKNDICKFYNYPEERVIEISLPVPNFVFNNIVTSNECIDIKKPFIFYPAQFWAHKNHIIILLAIKNLKEKYNLDFNVVFTGSDKGNLNYIKEKVKEFGLEKKIKFLGFVPIEDIIYFYKNAFALVFPSFFGPDNIPPLEAFALNCPVITARVEGVQYQLQDAVLLFDPKNELELVENIKKLYEDNNLKNNLIKNGKELVEKYKTQEYIKKIFKVIDDFERILRCWSSKDIYKHL